MRVEVRVNCSSEDMDIGMRALKMLYAFRRGEKRDQLEVFCAFCLDAPDGGSDGIAGSEHGVDENDRPLGDIGRDLEIILHRLQRVGIAVEPDMTDTGG